MARKEVGEADETLGVVQERREGRGPQGKNTYPFDRFLDGREKT